MQKQRRRHHRRIHGGVGAGEVRGRGWPGRGWLRLGVQQQRRELRGGAGKVRGRKQRHPEHSRLHSHVGTRLRRSHVLGQELDREASSALRLPDHPRGQAQSAEQLHLETPAESDPGDARGRVRTGIRRWTQVSWISFFIDFGPLRSQWTRSANSQTKHWKYQWWYF